MTLLPRTDLIVWATGVTPCIAVGQSRRNRNGPRWGHAKSRGAWRRTFRTYMPPATVSKHGIGLLLKAEPGCHSVPRLPTSKVASPEKTLAGGNWWSFRGVVGTQVVKVFDLAIARTGIL